MTDPDDLVLKASIVAGFFLALILWSQS